MSFGESTAYRLEIEGLGIQPVSSPALEQTLADGRVRVDGLLRTGLQREEATDIARGTLESSGMTAFVVDRRDNTGSIFTRWFAQRPLVRTWLTTDVPATGAATVGVVSSAGIAIGSVVHIDTEALLVDTVPDDFSFTVTSSGRGHWGTIRQQHYAGDDENANPIVSVERPLSIEGRRAYLYRYILGEDDLSGFGTAVFTGILTKDARLEADGAVWSLLIDPLTELLNQDLGADLSEPTSIRGVFYPSTRPGRFTLARSTTPDITGVTSDREFFEATGFFESQESFTAYLNAPTASGGLALSTRLNAWAGITDAEAFVANTGHWGIRWSGTDFIVQVPEGSASALPLIDGTIQVPDDPSALPLGVKAIVSGGGGATQQGKVPRGIFGAAALGPVGTGALSPLNLYLGGLVRPSAGDSIAIRWPDDTEALYEAVSADADEGFAQVRSASVPAERGMFPGQLPEIRVFRTYVTSGSLNDFRSALLANAPVLANRGGSPFVTSFDFDVWEFELARAAGGRSFLLSRQYIATESIKLAEFLEEEFKLAGVYPILNLAGQIDVRQLQLPTSTSIASLTIDDSVLTPDDPPRWERNAFGSISVGVLKTGYEPIQDRHMGTTYVVRDRIALGMRKAPRELEIKPKSTELVAVDQAQAVEIFSRALGIFGRPYVMVTCSVIPSIMYEATLGTIVKFSNASLPNVLTGRRGLGTENAAAGLIVGRSWSFEGEERGTLKILISDQSIAGYAASCSVRSNALVSGTEYDLTVDFMDPLNVASIAPAGAVLSDFYAVGDFLEILEFNTATTTPVQGTVTAIDDDTGVIRVDFDSAPVFTGNQYLRFADANNASQSQQRYAYYADSFSELPFGAKVFSA
ncbi:MAG: hypothetical protein AAGE52_01260 [Myxococcota bacterium]